MYWYCRNMGRISLKFIMQRFSPAGFSKDDFFVVGIVRGYEAALELVEEIAGKVYEQTGAADIRTYLLEREQEG